jgi:hypothetical protein
MGRGMDDGRAILDKEARQGGWIARARAAARNIAAGKGEITIDDVRAVCPPPDGVDPRIMGAVFQKNQFVRVGIAVSERRACHGRMIGVFRLRVFARARREGA